MRKFEADAKWSSCAECAAIARELNEAYAEAYEQHRPAADALYALIGGVEEDAERADQLLLTYRYQPQYPPPSSRPAQGRPGQGPADLYFAGLPNRVREAWRKSRRHVAETGHKLQRVRT